MKIFFVNIPNFPPPFAVQNSLTIQFYQKNWNLWIFSKKKKKCKFFPGSFSIFQPFKWSQTLLPFFVEFEEKKFRASLKKFLISCCITCITVKKKIFCWRKQPYSCGGDCMGMVRKQLQNYFSCLAVKH